MEEFANRVISDGFVDIGVIRWGVLEFRNFIIFVFLFSFGHHTQFSPYTPFKRKREKTVMPL